MPTSSRSRAVPTRAPRAPAKVADRQFVTALARGLAVMRCFDAQRPLLGTTEIAQMTKLPQPTVWRLCYTLQQLGYLVQTPDGDKLRVGMGVLGLGISAISSVEVGELVLPELAQIAKLTGAAVSLGVVDQDDILLVQRAQGDGPLLVNLTMGSRLSIATTSGGWAYLATLPREQRDQTLQRLRYQYSGRISELRTAVESAVTSFKATGFVMCDGFFHPDVLAVGAPAFDKEGRTAYVVTCGGPSLKTKFMRDDIGPRIARLARKITVALAGRA